MVNLIIAAVASDAAALPHERVPEARAAAPAKTYIALQAPRMCQEG
jgi:hypothetical protein